jgi:hypothetical protein
MSTQTQIEIIIESLQDLYEIMNRSRPVNPNRPDSVEDPSYPFVVGYTQGGISNVIYDLKRLKKQV